MQKIIGLFIIIVSSLALFFSYNKFQRLIDYHMGSDAQKIAMSIEDQIIADIQHDSNLREWTSINKVIIEYSGQRAKKIIEPFFSNPFEFDLNGSKKVEIVVLDLIDDKQPGIILQMSLIDLASNNKIGEHGVTYYYPLSSADLKSGAAPEQQQ